MHLARPGAAQAVAARWSYARWKPGTSLTAGYELEYADGETRWVTWKGYRDGKADALLGRREREVASDVVDERLAEHCVLPEGGAHLWAPPFDRALPGLERALDLRRTKRRFLEVGLFPGRRVRSGSSRARLLRYKPERRAVLQLDLRLRPLEGGPKTAERLGARALPLGEARRVAEARASWQDLECDLRAPRLVAFEESVGLLYETWLELVDGEADVLDDAQAAGELLARLHARPAPVESAPRAHGLAGAFELLGTQPELAEALASARGLGDAIAAPRVWTHGDFHPDQLRRASSDGAWCLLDLDRLGAGDPLHDLAAWSCDALVAERAHDLDQASAGLLEGYRRGGGSIPDRAALALAVARELVQRAAGALRRLEVDALQLARTRLDQALALAPGGARPRAPALAQAIPHDLALERIELSRDGELLLELVADDGPSWARLGARGLERLWLADDERLPVARRLRELGDEARVLAWRPGRRAVLDLGTHLLKAFRRGRLERSAARHAQAARAARSAGFEVPELLGLDEQLGGMRLARLPGERPRIAPGSAAAFERLGANLVRLQAQPLPADLERHDRAAELVLLDALAERTCALFGALPAGWTEARDAAAAALERVGERASVLAHRDLHDGQLLVEGQRLGLLDFDLLCAADPALDPGNLLAHLRLRELQGLAAPAGAEACGAAFLRGLGRGARDDAAHLAAWQAIAFARLALVYRARPPWKHVVSPLISMALEKARAEVP